MPKQNIQFLSVDPEISPFFQECFFGILLILELYKCCSTLPSLNSYFRLERTEQRLDGPTLSPGGQPIKYEGVENSVKGLRDHTI